MLWSYLHQHIGGLNGTMFINDKPICTSAPIHGTDPTNPPGNEKGYVVNFTRCIDSDNLHNAVRLEKGDKITVTALYDVDPKSTRALPFPGGKHGGVMGLFFFVIDCDPGSMTKEFVCNDNQCLRAYPGEFVSQADCE